MEECFHTRPHLGDNDCARQPQNMPGLGGLFTPTGRAFEPPLFPSGLRLAPLFDGGFKLFVLDDADFTVFLSELELQPAKVFFVAPGHLGGPGVRCGLL